MRTNVRWSDTRGPSDVKLYISTYWNPFCPVRFLGWNQLFVSDVLNERRVKTKPLCFLLVYVYVFCSRGEEC